MHVGLDDIDPEIARAMKERMGRKGYYYLSSDINWGSSNIAGKRNPTDEERCALQSYRKSVHLLIGGCAALLISLLLFQPVADGAQNEAAGAVILLLGLGTFFWLAATAAIQRNLRHSVPMEEMRAVFPLLTLTHQEKIYCATLLLLAQMEIRSETEPTLRRTLQDLNDLLEITRRLERRRLSALPIIGAHFIPVLAVQYDALRRRLNQTTDPMTHQSLSQSLQMCANQLENARAFALGMERLYAQQEAIVSMLLSVQSTLARKQIAPEPQDVFALQEITDTVTRMRQEADAVEKTLVEVIEL
jgi:hypothetical protein